MLSNRVEEELAGHRALEEGLRLAREREAARLEEECRLKEAAREERRAARRRELEADRERRRLDRERERAEARRLREEERARKKAMAGEGKVEELDGEEVEFEVEAADAANLEKVEWVYENLEARELPRRGPTRGALAMLRWARKNRKAFYTLWKGTVLSKGVLDRQVEEVRRRSGRDLRGRLAEILGGLPDRV